MYGHAGGYSQLYKHGNVRALGSRHVNPIQSSYTYYIYTHLTTGGETYIEHSGLLLLTALQPSGHYLCYYAPDYQRREHADDTMCSRTTGDEVASSAAFSCSSSGQHWAVPSGPE